jgi:ubiquinone/menaquinone biosynthesis C-methylase UbiE
MDYSTMQVRRAEKNRIRRKIPNCTFTRGNAMNLPLQDGLFDTAVSIGSIKHWPDGVRGLREIHRVLKPGGRCIIAETDREASDKALRAFIGRFNVWFIPDGLLFQGLRHVIFGQSYTQSALADALRLAGFRNINCRRVFPCPYNIVQARK